MLRSSRAPESKLKRFKLADIFATPRQEMSVINFALTDTKLVPSVEEAIRQCELEDYTTTEQVISSILYTYFVHVCTLERWDVSVFANNECWESDWLDEKVIGYDHNELDVKFGVLAKYIVGYYDTVVSAFIPILHELKRDATCYVGVERVINDKVIVFIEYHGY